MKHYFGSTAGYHLSESLLHLIGDKTTFGGVQTAPVRHLLGSAVQLSPVLWKNYAHSSQPALTITISVTKSVTAVGNDR